MLENALYDLEAGAGANALDALLDAWRSSRDPRLGRAIARLGERQTIDPTEALASIRTPALHQAWIDLARQAPSEALSPLLEGMRAYIENTRYTWPLIEHLTARDPDPRIATLAIGLLRRYDQLKGSCERLARRLADCVERHGDASHGPTISPSSAHPGVWRRLELLALRLEERSSALPVSEAQLAALEAAIDREDLALVRTEKPKNRQATTPEELLALVYADPDDDGARLVYADLLVERGDPRGAFILLQFQARGGTLTDKQWTRMNALQRKHQKVWLRSIWPAFGNNKGLVDKDAVQFERGFPVSARVRQPRRAPSDLWDQPEWSTLRRLEGSCVLGPSMRGLEEAILFGESRFAGDVPRLRRLQVVASRALLTSEWPELPALTALTLVFGEIDAPEALALLMQQPFAARLRELRDLQATLQRETTGWLGRVTLQVQGAESRSTG